MTERFEPTLLLDAAATGSNRQTVVLLCDFVPEGAFGLVLNRPTDERPPVWCPTRRSRTGTICA
jgi:putative AlgH/UPF0301 family transcriptional regulator